MSRILLKLSGEYLSGAKGFGLCSSTIEQIVVDIKDVLSLGIQVAILVGGGNVYRGGKGDPTLDRTILDSVGMLSTMINALMLFSHFKKNQIACSIMSSTKIDGTIPLFDTSIAKEDLMKGKVLILAGGLGLPFFTTDTAAALRSCQIQADLMLKGTKVDGVYSSDPIESRDAIRFNQITYQEAIDKNLKIMDTAAMVLLKNQSIPLCVFSLKDGIKNAILRTCPYTMIQ